MPCSRRTPEGLPAARLRPLSLAERALAAPSVSLRDLLAGDQPPLTGTHDVAVPALLESLLASGFPAIAAATPGEDDKPAKTTTIAYREVLEALYVLDPLPAWVPTRKHRSTTSPTRPWQHGCWASDATRFSPAKSRPRRGSATAT